MYVYPHLTRLLSSPERAQLRASPERAAGQVCNPDTPAATYDTGDTWFPSNSSRLIVDDGISAILRSKAESKPFYLNLWFHISHAPMRPTAAQYQALADCEYLKLGLSPRCRLTAAGARGDGYARDPAVAGGVQRPAEGRLRLGGQLQDPGGLLDLHAQVRWGRRRRREVRRLRS